MSYDGTMFDGIIKLMEAYENLNKPVDYLKHNTTCISFEENQKRLEEADRIYDYFSEFFDDYENVECVDLNFDETRMNLHWILSHVEFFKKKFINTNGVSFESQILQLSKEELDAYLEKQNNIISMLNDKIMILIDNLNIANYREFNRLGMFLLNKLSVCIQNVEGHKKNMSLLENFPLKDYHLKNKYDYDCSLYVSMFFDRKYEDIMRDYPYIKK